jgi:hypothetical protein
MVVLFLLPAPGEPEGMTFRRQPGRPGPLEPRAPSTVINFRIPDDMLERLDALAKKRRTPRNQLIREAVQLLLEKQAPEPKEDPPQD